MKFTRNILVCLLLLIPACGCNLLSSLPDVPPAPPGPVDPQPGPGPNPGPRPQPEPTIPEQSYWEALAVLVERDTFVNTDQVKLTADRMKSAGWISDVGRLSEMAKRRSEITEANRADIARQVRGK